MKTQMIGGLGLGIFGQTIATELSSFGARRYCLR